MAKLRQYRILSGKYEEGDGENKTVYGARDGHGKLRPGLKDIIVTEKPLDRLFGSDKFRLISSEEAELGEATNSFSDEFLAEFGEFTVAELKTFAADEGILIDGCTRKPEILQAIQEALAEA